MVTFFFYHHFTNTYNLNKLHHNYVIEHGYVMVKSYDEDTGHVCLCKTDNLTRLYGIVVEFKQITFNEIITKLNGIEEFRLCQTKSYNLDTIQVHTVDDHSLTSYIVYSKN